MFGGLGDVSSTTSHARVAASVRQTSSVASPLKLGSETADLDAGHGHHRYAWPYAWPSVGPAAARSLRL